MKQVRGLLSLAITLAGHARKAAAGRGRPQPAVPGQEEARTGTLWPQEGHRGPGIDRPEGKYEVVTALTCWGVTPCNLIQTCCHSRGHTVAIFRRR